MTEVYMDSIFWVEVDRIVPNPFQPRREFDQARLQDLAESIRQYGVLQPLVVTRKEIPREDGGIFVQYELIAGERRLRASKLAGLPQVPVIIRTAQETDEMKLELAIIENLQREDLNAIDRAKAFERLVKEFGFKHGDVGKKVGKSREYVSNTLRLLTLSDEIQGYVVSGKLSEGHTRPILMLNHRPEEQLTLVKEILLKKLTVRETENIARRIAQDKVRNKSLLHPELYSIEKKLTEQLGTRVQIEPRDVGGRLVISYFSEEDLQFLIDAIHAREAMPSARADVAELREKGILPVELTVTEVAAVASAPIEASNVTDEVSQSSEEGATLESDLEKELAENPELLDDRSKEDADAIDEELYSIKNFSI